MKDDDIRMAQLITALIYPSCVLKNKDRMACDKTDPVKEAAIIAKSIFKEFEKGEEV